MDEEGDGKKPPEKEIKSTLPPAAGSTRKKPPRGPPTEAERQFAAAAVEVMCGGATPEAQHAFILLHPRLLPSNPPSSARRATRRLFQLWLRECAPPPLTLRFRSFFFLKIHFYKTYTLI
jgi:hypothetical protein